MTRSKKKQKKVLKKFKCKICIIVLFAIIVIWIMVIFEKANTHIQFPFAKDQICFDTSCISIKKIPIQGSVLESPLSAKKVSKNKGILYIFQDADIYGLMTRNILDTIDIIRLDEQYRILYTKKNAQACVINPCPTFSSPFMSTYILQLEGWAIEDLGLKVGDVWVIK